MHPHTRRAIQRRILAWYEQHGRHDLPWRRARTTLYHIVVSEIMLQQTTVATVYDKYKVFIAAFPSWRALAAAPQSEVLRQWRGLGYNRRALNLHRCAQMIVRDHAGRVPTTPKACEQLPGIGPYTARAILAFGRNADVAAVDVNIARLLARWHVTDARAVSTTQQAATWMLPHGRSRDWHSALMDFASAVCTKRAPQCATCPLARLCPSAAAPHDEASVRRREPGRAECGTHVPRRIYRGRIVDALRDHALAADVLGQRIKADWDAHADGAWLAEILATLRAEGMIVRRGDTWQLR